MDQHWRNLINASGGTGLNLSRYPDNDRSDRIQAITNGYPRVYEDVNGVRFTVEDVMEHRPGLNRDSVVKYVTTCQTFEELITPKKKGGRRVSWTRAQLETAVRRWRNGEAVVQAAEISGVPRSSLYRELRRMGFDPSGRRQRDTG